MNALLNILVRISYDVNPIFQNTKLKYAQKKINKMCTVVSKALPFQSFDE